MTEETKPNVITMELAWNILRPDTRQYKQQSVELFPGFRVAVNIPNTPEYIAKILKVRVEMNNDEEIVYLTPLGMKYIQDQLEAVYAEEKKAEETTESWGDEETQSAEKKAETSEDDWGSTFDEEDEKPASSKPDTESWNEDGEEW